MPENVTNNHIAVRCQGVTKVFGEGAAAVYALRGIDLEVRAGELMMLVGPSGCGKTTLISIIAGILKHDEGDCTVFGQDLERLSSFDRTRYRGRHIGFVFQAYNLIPSLTAAQNVAVPLMINGQRWGEAEDRADALLERVGFDERLKRAMPAHLSGGQQQRVAIARAMVHEPSLIVCDEPTAALDAVNGQKVMAVLREVALDEKRALIVVTHDARIFHFADRIAHMNDGRVDQIVDHPNQLQATFATEARK